MASEARSRLPLTYLAYHILLALADKSLHGYGIIKEVSERTGGRTRLEAGTLYAAIKRLKEDGLIVVSGEPADSPRGRRDYGLTPLGEEVLRLESERLANLVEIARAKRVIPEGSKA